MRITLMCTKEGKKKIAVDSKKTLRALIKRSYLLRRLKMKFVVPLVDAMSSKPVRAGRYIIREVKREYKRGKE